MSVDHVIYIGYGFIVPNNFIESAIERCGLDEWDCTTDEWLDRFIEKYPLVDYIEGGSYYGSKPIEYALIVKSTKRRASDLEGFMHTGRPKITAEERIELEQALRDIHGFDPGQLDTGGWSLNWQVAGLWS